MAERFSPEESFALALDEADELASFRARFHVPCGASGREVVYFAGNSLGLQPQGVAEAVAGELSAWARLGVEGHFAPGSDWYSYQERSRQSAARLVGAAPAEVVAMNSTTVNLHLMLASFYRPTRARYRILVEPWTFPSDLYAVQSVAHGHGYDPDDAVLLAPTAGEAGTVATEALAETLECHAGELALVLLSGVNFYTGQAFDVERIAATTRRLGLTLGLDLCHSVGNVPLALHEWGVDFAVWCTYKYLNAGPGAVAGCFVHERHANRPELPRLAGWWGNDPATRFRVHLERRFRPTSGAAGWQVSNPPIFSLAPLSVSLAIFDEAGMARLRRKSERLTAFLEAWIDHAGASRIEQLTPRDPAARGCQLSLRARERPRTLFERLRQAEVVGDFREPDVVRVAPAPLYNSFHDVWRFGRALEAWARESTCS